MREDTVKMLGQLNEISESLDALKVCVQRVTGNTDEVRANLEHIWTVTRNLEFDLARPEIVAGYRRDAIEQVHRVSQLIGEADEMEERQLISIGYGCELAREKIKDYMRMARNAAKKAVAATPTEA